MSLTITVNGGGTFTASMEEGPVSFTASLAAVGPQGPAGANGAPGQGVPVGGTTGQVLAKASGTDYDTAWVAANPFNQSLNIADDVAFNSISTNWIYANNLNVATELSIDEGGEIIFGDSTAQYTALPNGTADGYIVIWNAANSTYVSSPNETRALFMLGTNKTGTTIAKGKAVYVSGATGNHPEITLAQANSEISSASTIGITSEEIANNGTGKVIVSGRLENVNTNGFAAGDTLYLSPSSAGGFTTTFPTQPNHGVLLGYVTRANANTGVIEVVVKNYQELEEQSDVLLTSKANNDLLSYESSSGLWKNKSFSTLGLLTSATAASTYAPIASPTFTGTVTIPAGASISGFAPLASPALTGTPTAPTAAAATNTTQIATTAFVQQEVPAASTTAAGKVELATDAEAVAATSTTLAVTPANLSASYQDCDHFDFQGNAWTQSVSGTGASTAQIFNGKVANAPTSAVGYGILYSPTYIINRGAASNSPATWGKNYALSFRFTNASGTIDTNSVGRILFGKGSATTTPGLAVRGFGVEFSVGGLLKILAHDGTNLTTTNTTHTVTSVVSQDVTLRLNSSGTVECFVNGTSVGTSTGGPTSGTNSVGNAVHIEAENTTTLTNTRLALIVQNLRLTKDI